MRLHGVSVFSSTWSHSRKQKMSIEEIKFLSQPPSLQEEINPFMWLMGNELIVFLWLVQRVIFLNELFDLTLINGHKKKSQYVSYFVKMEKTWSKTWVSHIKEFGTWFCYIKQKSCYLVTFDLGFDIQKSQRLDLGLVVLKELDSTIRCPNLGTALGSSHVTKNQWKILRHILDFRNQNKD